MYRVLYGVPMVIAILLVIVLAVEGRMAEIDAWVIALLAVSIATGTLVALIKSIWCWSRELLFYRRNDWDFAQASGVRSGDSTESENKGHVLLGYPLVIIVLAGIFWRALSLLGELHVGVRF